MGRILSTLHAGAGLSQAMADGGTSLDDEVDAVLWGSFTGTPGNDTLTGGAANDSLYGLGGDDLLLPGAGDDLADGGEGADTVSYGGIAGGGATIDLTAAMVFGGPEIGTDTLLSVEHANGTLDGDVIGGTGAANLLFGDAGDDMIYGHAGDDFLTGGAGADVIHGGGGNDTISYAGAGTGMTFEMGSLGPGSGRVYAGEPIGMDSFYSIENVAGGEAADVIGGDGSANAFYGGGGDDQMFGWTGADLLSGGDGNDRLYAQQDDDIVDGGAGDDSLHGWAGNDTLTGGAGADIFVVGDPMREGIDLILDYSRAAGDALDVPEPTGSFPTDYSYFTQQDGMSVDVFAYNGFVYYQIFELADYGQADGVTFV